jgi:hypothetical protein
MKRLMIALALVALAPIAAHAETNIEAYNRGWASGYVVAEQVAAYCRMAASDATYPIDDVTQVACRKMQEAFDKIKKGDDEWMDNLQKDVFGKMQKNGRQR